jgi:hypothetical protein
MNTYFITIHITQSGMHSSLLGTHGFVFYATEEDLHTSLDAIIAGMLKKNLGISGNITYRIYSLKNISR